MTIVVALAAAAACAAGLMRLRSDSVRSVPGRAALSLRLWLDAVVLGAAAFTLLPLPFDESRARLALSIIVLAAAAAAHLALGRGPIRSPRLRMLEIVVFNVSAAILAGEAGLRLLVRVRPSVLLAQDLSRPVEKLRQSRLPPGTLHLGFPLNSGGHYDEEFRPKTKDRTLVLQIGDSFSFGAVPHYYHFTTVAERLLARTDIDNMGVSATAPPEYLHLLLTEGLPLHPDAVVADVFVGNDLDYWPVEPATGLLARFLDRRNCLLLQAPRRLAILLSEERRRAALGGAPAPEHAILDPRDLERAYPWLADPLQETPAFSADRYLAMELERATGVSLQSEPDYALRLAPIEKMRQMCAPKPLLVMIIPDVFQIEDALWDEMRQRATVALDRDRPQRVLGAWLEQRAIPYLDLRPALRAVPPMADGWRHVYRRNDSHFNARGNDVAGRALAAFLKEHVPELR